MFSPAPPTFIWSTSRGPHATLWEMLLQGIYKNND